MDGWMRVLRPFNSISVISRWWKGARSMLPYSYEPPHNKTNKMTCAPSEDDAQALCCPHEETLGPERTARLIRLGGCPG